MSRRITIFAILLALAGAAWTAPAATAQSGPGQGPGGPILVVTNDPFGGYYAEILRAEGLNEFAVAGLGSVSAQMLASYQAVVLAPTALTAEQVAMFDGWVQAGGNLIAMRPDPQLAGLLGLAAAGGTVGNGYIDVDESKPPGAGITGVTMQFHGVADRYTAPGATTVATLHATGNGASTGPAVTTRSVGGAGGSAAAFTYDLARSVVGTRQGNVALAGIDQDADGPIRSNDLYAGAWLDFSKVRIPQADEQQRLLANLITQLTLDRVPLPRFWYLPRGEKAAIVMTGDDHGDGSPGTAGQFEGFKDATSDNCNVAAWACVRSTSYLFPEAGILSPAQATSYQAQGFELALHLDTGCNDYDSEAELAGDWAAQLTAFAAQWPGLQAPRTSRTHCVAWSDWAGTPKVGLTRPTPIRFDTNYYYWPEEWVEDRPGLFTGSGFPMRFADVNGAPLDVYQAATQLTDELASSPWAYVLPHTKALIDGALNNGYYGVFTTNMHTDHPVHAGADAIVAEALPRGVPVVSAKQMLEWLDGRDGSAFQGLSFVGGRLTFTISGGANGLEAMLPAHSAAGALQALTRGGAAVPVTARTVKGIEYVVFDAAPGAYVASYPGTGGPGDPPPPPGGSDPSGDPGIVPAPPKKGDGTPGGGGSASDRSAPRVALRRTTVRARRNGVVVLRVSCPTAEEFCRTDLRLHGASRRLARALFLVAGGKTAKKALQLPPATRARLARAGSLRLTVRIKARDAAGNQRTTRTHIKVLAPRRR